MFAVKDVLCARQPVFNREQEIFGYELLYRTQHTDSAEFANGDVATCELVLNACASINDDEVLSRYPLFFNVTRSLLLSESFLPVETNKAIIEINSSEIVDEHIVNRIYQLKKLGYVFSLDNYDFSPHCDPLLPIIKYVKVDVLAVNLSDFQKDIDHLTAMGKVLIAEKVENLEMYVQCNNMGFTFFQGFYLEKPQIVKGKKVSANVQLALSIINKLQSEEVSFNEISYMVSRDPKLSFQLLKIINSSAQGLKREVSSVKQAVVFLGITSLKKWVMLISLLQNSDAPDAFFKILLTRAKACELIASSIQLKDEDSFFMVGLFSGLDRLLSLEMVDIIGHLKLSEDVCQALLYHEGFKGTILKKVQLLERGHWKSLYKISPWSEAQVFAQVLEKAREWAEEIMS